MNIEDFLPRLILIGDRFTDEATGERIIEAVRGGIRWVHLRDHRARSDAFELVVPTMTARIRDEASDTAISINGRPDIARHLALHYHGQTHPDAIAAARASLERSAVIGYSAHSIEEAEAAVAHGADYVFFSPIFPTLSKPEAEPVGLDALRRCVERLEGTVVYALGGITPENLASCLDAGAYGVAVLSGILHADDPASATRAYLTSLRNGSAGPGRWGRVMDSDKSISSGTSRGLAQSIRSGKSSESDRSSGSARASGSDRANGSARASGSDRTSRGGQVDETRRSNGSDDAKGTSA